VPGAEEVCFDVVEFISVVVTGLVVEVDVLFGSALVEVDSTVVWSVVPLEELSTALF